MICAVATRCVLAQRTEQATKANFVSLAKENWNWNRSPDRFYTSRLKVL